MIINAKEAKREMKKAYQAGRMNFYGDMYKLMYTAWNLNLISHDDFMAIADQDSKLFEEANKE